MRVLTIAIAVGALVFLSASAAGASLTRPAGTTASSDPADVALAAVEQRPAAADGATPDELSAPDVSKGSAGTTIARMDQDVDGVPVLGGEVVVALDGKRRVVRVDGAVTDATSAAVPTISARRARLIAVGAVRKGVGRGLVASPARLVVHDPQVTGGSGPPSARTAWEVTVSRGADVRVRVYVDARAGIPYQAINLIRHAKSVAVCDAANTSNKWPCTPSGYARFNSATATGNAEVDTAYDLVGATYDFYAGLGRDSLDNAGMRLVSTVNWCESTCPYDNAFWDGTQMVFGPGLASADDVVAHELTHGITERTSNLVYWYQSGAINEALSDIMGELFDLLRGPAPLGEWKIAENSTLGVIRDMANPPAYGDPDRMTSPYYATGIWDNGGVHSNSGVANKAAYLIADGGSFNGRTVAPVGRSKSAALWYQTGLTLRMSSDYSDLADALEQTCDGFASIGYRSFTATDCAQVRSAVLATEMRIDPLVTPPVCPAGGTAVTAFADTFASGFSTGWTAAPTVVAGRTPTQTIGTNHWYPSSATSPDGLPMTWPTSSSSNVRAVDTADRSDSSLTMSTPVTVPANGYLRFSHWHQFESSISVYGAGFGYQGYDAGVVEYSTNNGSTWNDIAGLATVNGYTGTINADLFSDNPLEGRGGFIAASNGAVTTQVDLSSLAGQNVQFRFRQVTDTGTGGYGWYIDDVAVNGCVTVPDPPVVNGVTSGDGQLSVDFTLGGSGGSAPTNLRYSLDDGATWATRSPASTASPLVITGLTNGTEYRVRLQTISSGGTSAGSNMIARTPTGPVVRTIAITSPVASSYAFSATPPTIVATPSPSPGGNISYSSSTPGVCTVGESSGTVTFMSAGTCSITASVAESGNLLPATSSPISFQVTASAPAAPVATQVTPGDGQLSVAFTLGGTGGAPATNIEYSVNGGQAWQARNPASAQSPLVITGLANGTTYDVQVRVVAPGGTSTASTSLTGTPSGPISRSIAITSTVASSYAFSATPPTISATPSQAGGAITYATATPGACTIDAATGAVTFVSAATCSVTASVAASGQLLAATSAATTFAITAVAPAAPTVTSVTSGDGQLSVAFTAGSSGGAAIDNIEYSLDDGANWVTRSPASTASPLVIGNLGSGTTYQVRLRAVGTGGTSGQSNSVAQSTTGPTPRTIAITSAIAASYAFTATPPVASATPSAGGGAISYASSTPGTCTVDASTGGVTFVAAGTCAVTATVAASGGYVAATSPAASFEITTTAPGAPTIALVSPGDGQLSVSFVPGSTGGAAPTNVRYSTDGGASWTARVPASTASPLVIDGLQNGRSYDVQIALIGPGGAGSASATSSQAPNGPVPRTIAISAPASGTYAFDATPPTISATPSVSGGSVSYASSTPGTCTINATTGAVAFVSAGSCTITASVAASGNLLPATSSPTTFAITAVSPGAPTVTWISPDNAQLSVAFQLGPTGGAVPQNIRYSLDGGANWVDRSPASIASPLILGGLTNGDMYDVRLQVIGPGGTSAQSNLVTRAPNGPVARTLTLAAPMQPSFRITDPAPTLTATPSRSGGSITYSSSTPSVCLVGSSTGAVLFVAPGTCRISASISASGSLLAATATAVAFEVLAAELPAPSTPATPQAPVSQPTSPPPSATPAPTPFTAPAVTLPTAARWTSGGGAVGTTRNRTLSTTIPLPPGTTMSVRATSAGKRAVTGTCRTTAGSARCTVRVTARGRWTITITPVTAGVPGKPIRSTVQVR
jgi:bacillolysin